MGEKESQVDPTEAVRQAADSQFNSNIAELRDRDPEFVDAAIAYSRKQLEQSGPNIEMFGKSTFVFARHVPKFKEEYDAITRIGSDVTLMQEMVSNVEAITQTIISEEEISLEDICSKLGMPRNFNDILLRHLKQELEQFTWENPLFKLLSEDCLLRYRQEVDEILQRVDLPVSGKESAIELYFSTAYYFGKKAEYDEIKTIFIKLFGKDIIEGISSGKREVSELGEENIYFICQLLKSYSKNPKEIAVGLNEQSLGAIFEIMSKLSENEHYDNVAKDRAVGNMAKVEALYPGGVKALMEEFGIVEFQRYPVEILIDQLRNKDNLGIDYGLVVYPQYDTVNAFDCDQKIFGALYKQLIEMGVHIRVAEADSKISLARRLIHARDKYGAASKPKFMILGGHGTDSTIQFGDDQGHPELEYVKIDDLVGNGSKRLLGSEFFPDNATLILVSCSTGKPGGIAQRISKIAGTSFEVIPPDEDTNLVSINVSSLNGCLKFDVEYTPTENTDKTFRGGRLVN